MEVVFVRQDAVGGTVADGIFPKTQPLEPIFIGRANLFLVCVIWPIPFRIFPPDSPVLRSLKLLMATGGEGANEIDKRYVRPCETPAQSE